MPPKKKKQPYIPGLTQRPDDSEFPEKVPEKTDDDILIDEFLANKKNPTMCLHEVCARNKYQLEFKDEVAEYRPGYNARYGVRVFVDNQKYRQGVGANKKEAKNEASKLAFRALVGLDDFTPEEIHEGNDGAEILEVMRLEQFCKERNLPYSREIKQDQEKKFVCIVLVGGIDQIIEKKIYKEEAILSAHARAIQLLGLETTSDATVLSELTNFPALAINDIAPDPSLAYLRQERATEKLHEKLAGFPSLLSLDHHLAAFFICTKGKDPVGELVAFGTGNSSIGAENLSMDGRCLLDSTCVTVARRSFRRYLANQMMICLERRNPTIFTDDGPGKLKVADNFSVHLYLSHPPDGDYQDFLERPVPVSAEEEETIKKGGHLPHFTEDTHGFLKCRSEGAIELTCTTPEQKSFSQVQQMNELRLMSQSDKLLKWNILGLQGAKFSLFTQPVYLDSITIGYQVQSDHGHLCRAVCCRVYEDLQELLRPGYKVNHPVLQFSPRQCKESLHQVYKVPTTISINWNFPDQLLEIIDGETGKTNAMSPFQVSRAAVSPSRLCKAAMHLKWFKDLCREKKKEAQFAGLSPQESKAAAEDYLESKEAFYQKCMEWGIGKWIHAPPELDMFVK